MKVAYLVNQYPKVSHSFIRREIQAVERRGVAVARYALRGWDADIVDADDRAERRSTRYLLAGGGRALAGAVVATLLRKPGRLVAALSTAIRLGRRADRPLAVHLVYLAEACLLARWMEADGIHHLHAHFGTNAAEVALLARRLGGPPYSFTVHGPEEFDSPRGLHLQEKIRDAAFVVAISSFGRSQLYRWADAGDWPRVVVVHCGLEAAFHAVEPVPVPDAPRLVCVGRLSEQKGQLLLVEAAGRLARRGVRFTLVLAGDGEMRPDVERAIAAGGVADRVTITGWISGDAVREQILASRALVLTSFAEGLPVVCMEAMALGRPVLATSIAGIPELVRDGVDGRLFPAGDVDAIVDVIERFLALPAADVERMGRAARIRAIERHAVDVEAARLVRLFESSAAGVAITATHADAKRPAATAPA